MNHRLNTQFRYRRLLFALLLATVLLCSLWMAVSAGTPLGKAGYLDYSYQGWNGFGSPTGEKPESKLWWNDGFWWGSMYSPGDNKMHIFRLNWGTQTWEDSGVILDPRPNSKADVLWSQSNQKLYVASHIGVSSSDDVKSCETPITAGNCDLLFRYTYTPTLQTYTLDAGFPVTVNKDKTETLVLARDATGDLWVAYVSKQPRPQVTDPVYYRLYVNFSNDDGKTWGAPFIPTLDITNSMTDTTVASDDIAAIVAVGNKVGLMWNSTLDSSAAQLHFAYHDTGISTASQAETGWIDREIVIPGGSDDHVSLKSLLALNNGQVFAAVKTNASTVSTTTQPLIGLVALDINNPTDFAFRQYSATSDNDSRPIMLIDEGDPANNTDNQAYIFVSGKAGGSKICYKSLAIKTPLASMGQFAVGDCGISFIEDVKPRYDLIDNPTTIKQSITKTMGLVVLASDHDTITTGVTSKVYVHNVLGNPPPVVTARWPNFNAVNIPVTNTVNVTFSKNIDPVSISSSSFSLTESSGVVVTSSVSYDSVSRLGTLTPAKLLKANTTYTAKLTNAIKDTLSPSQKLNEGIDPGPVIEQWNFTTGPATAGFAQASYSGNEIDNSITITVALNTLSTQPVTVTYTVGNGTAIAGSDYTATTGTLVFAALQMTRTFTVPIINDDTANEGNEIANLALSNAQGVLLDPQTSAASLLIVDDDSATVQFSPTSFSVDENGGVAVVNVTLSRASASPVSVSYATTVDGTATPGSDYAPLNGVLTFDPLQTSKSITVEIVNDSIDEPSETVHLALSSPTPNEVLLGNPGFTATLTINDDDALTMIQFTSANYSVNEGDGVAMLSVTINPISSLPVSVDFTTGDISATAASDYQAIAGTITIPPGQATGAINVEIANDVLDEDDETLNIALSNPLNGVLNAPFNATLAIADDDPAPLVQFAQTAISKGEGGGSADVIVTLSAASGRIVTVNYVASNGTATANLDYAPAAGTLIFAPGETSQTFQVALLEDAFDEDNEVVNLALSEGSNATLDAAGATLTITDNDPTPKLSFSSANYSAFENTGAVTITVSLSNPTAKEVRVNYATTDGSAKSGNDYTAANGQLVIPVGQTSASFSIVLLNDAQAETEETLSVTLNSPVNALLDAQSSATITIGDDDGSAGQRLHLPLVKNNS